MKFSLDMPDVATCEARACAYNADGDCHARAITVGGVSEDVACDTYFESDGHVRGVDRRAGVGACKARGCQHNDDLECQAPHIQVGRGDAGVNCLTFAPG